MEKYTINNPGCYHSAIIYASKITGIPYEKEIITSNINDLFNVSKSGKKSLKYKSYCITVNDKEGNSIPYFENGKRFDISHPEFIPHVFKARTLRSLHDFGLVINEIKQTYKDSLGGGWYQNVSMFSINDNYFAMMECSCGHY